MSQFMNINEININKYHLPGSIIKRECINMCLKEWKTNNTMLNTLPQISVDSYVDFNIIVSSI